MWLVPHGSIVSERRALNRITTGRLMVRAPIRPGLISSLIVPSHVMNVSRHAELTVENDCLCVLNEARVERRCFD